MAAPQDEQVVRYQLRRSCDLLLAALESQDEQALTSFGLEWQALVALLGDSLATTPPRYSIELYQLANEVASRVGVILRHFQRIEEASQQFQARLAEGLRALLPQARSRALAFDGVALPSQRGVPTTPLALRQWFLDHLDEPYLDKAQKVAASDQLGISVSSIKQFLTNARRRSGWNDFRRTYGQDDRDITGDLIRRIRRMEQEPALEVNIPAGAAEALDGIHRYVAAGLEVGVRDGLEEAIDAELRRIAEEKVQRRAPQPTQPEALSSKGKQPVLERTAMGSTSTALTASTSGTSFQPEVSGGALFPSSIQQPLTGTTSTALTASTSQMPVLPEAWDGALSPDTIQQLEDILASFVAQPQGNGETVAHTSPDPAFIAEFPDWLQAADSLQGQQQAVDQFTSSDAIDSRSAPMDIDQPPGSSPAGSLFSGEPTPGPPTPTAAQLETAPPVVPTSFVRSSSVPLSGLWGRARAPNAPSDVAPPTWTTTPAISSAPKGKRRSPIKRTE